MLYVLIRKYILIIYYVSYINILNINSISYVHLLCINTKFNDVYNTIILCQFLYYFLYN